MDNTISTDDKKPILNFKEVKRFHQISEQFFKGSHDFFVEQQEKTQKFINEKLKNSFFHEHYKEAIQKVKDNITNKISFVKNNLKKDLGSKIMNFIIYLELGIIAISQSPFKIQDALDKIDKSKLIFPVFNGDYDQMFDSFCHMLIENGVYIDFDNLIKDSTQGLIKNFRKILYNIVNGLDYFFNNQENNAFLTCLGECAFKVGENGGGAVGIVLEFLMKSINKSVAKRPNLNHFLTYGVNPYLLASQIETEIHTIIGHHSTLHSSSVKVGRRIGGTFYGVVNENDENDNSFNPLQLLFGIGVAELVSEIVEKENDEEDDVLKVLSDLQGYRVAATETTVRTYQRGYISGSTLFETDQYKAMSDFWDHINSVDYDLEYDYTAKLKEIQLHFHYANPKTLAAQSTFITTFYNTHKTGSNPVARRICTEIENRLMINGVIMGEHRSGYMEAPVVTFAPVVLYAIVEFEQMQKMTSLMYQQNDFRMQMLYESLSNNRETELLTNLRNDMRLYENGVYNTQTLLEKLNENLKQIRGHVFFEVLNRLRPDIVFTSFRHLPYMINSIVRGFNHVQTSNSIIDWIKADSSVLQFMGGIGGISSTYHISPSQFNSTHEYEENEYEENLSIDIFNYGRTKTIVEQDGINYDGNEERTRYTWKSNEYILSSISRRHVEKKLQIKQLINQRRNLWGIINMLVKSLSRNVIYENIQLNTTNG